MLFSTKAEYGVRLMVELGRRDRGDPESGGEPVALSTVAEAEILPLSYLEHLVAKLREAGPGDLGARRARRLPARAARGGDRDARRGPGARGADRPDGVLQRRARGPGALLARGGRRPAPARPSCSGPAFTAGSPRRWPAPRWPTWSSSPIEHTGAESRSPARPRSRASDNPRNGDRWPIWRSATCT